MIRNLIIERNVAHLNQAQGTPLTIELLVSMIGIDSFTIFFDRNYWRLNVIPQY